MADDGGYIYPTEQDPLSGFPQGGLTKREWFAGQALVGLIGAEKLSKVHSEPNVLACEAFRLADAMVLASSRK